LALPKSVESDNLGLNKAVIPGCRFRGLLKRVRYVGTRDIASIVIEMSAVPREIGFSGSHQQRLRSNDRAETGINRFDAPNENARLQISQIGSSLRFRPCGGLQHVENSAAVDSRPSIDSFRTASRLGARRQLQ
jgi:hypothetical protein